MPKMSMTMETGELISYHVQAGERVKSGQVLFEVMTDKIDMEVESPADGVIEQLVGEIGGVIEIGKPVLIMQTDTEVMSFDFGDQAPLPPAPVENLPTLAPIESVAPAPIAPAPIAPAPASLPDLAPQEIRAVPKARALAADRGIDLRNITPTGPDQTITYFDITAAAPTPEQLKRQNANKALIAKGLELTRNLPQTSFTRALPFEKREAGINQIVTAWAKALRARPELNLSGKSGEANSHIGVALIIESRYGSALPVFTDPDLLPGEELPILIEQTVQAAQKGKVPLAMLNGATTSIFDLTKYQMGSATPVLFPGQLTSMSIGLGNQGERTISLTIDLRYLDFYDGAALLDSFMALLKGESR
jgi:pyruvate dehydrogenase E2 component (dihydrolipoamide acetyltransferase)